MTFAARIGPGGTVLHVRAADSERFVRFDGEGRWVTVATPEGFAHRTMDGRAVRRSGTGVRDLTADEADAVHGRAGALARSLRADALAAGEGLQVLGGGGDDLDARLAVAEAWTPARLRAESDRFDAAYPEPVRILPPDRYRDVVVTPATGCPNAGCTFCAFYRGDRFSRLDRATFRAHLEAVRGLFGAALDGRDGVFLGSASALSLPDRSLIEVLGDVQAAFGVRKRGIAAFQDPDRSPRRDSDARARLVEAGLGQVVLGLETGHGPLRGALGKRSTADGAVGIARGWKAAGARVGVTILAGVGTEEARDAHEAGTREAVAAMDLGPADLVYVSPLVSPSGDVAGDDAVASLREALAGATRAKLVPYRVERFRYYA